MAIWKAGVPIPYDEELLLVGDCVDGLRLFADESVACVFADPPYNLSSKELTWVGKKGGGDWYKINESWDCFAYEDYEEFTARWIAEAVRILVPGGALWVCCSLHNEAECAMAVKRSGMKLLNIVTWVKLNPVPNKTRRSFTHACEYLLFSVKGSNWKFNYSALKEMNPERTKDGSRRAMRDAWELPVCQGRERLHRPDGRAAHPTQKPLELVRRVLVASTDPGDLVVDPFFGSGTTGHAAKDLGRRWIGIESKEEYVPLSEKRLGLLPQRVARLDTIQARRS